MTSHPFHLVACLGFVSALLPMAAQVAVRVEPVDLHGPRALQEQSKTAVVRDYLHAWQSLQSALGQNRPEALQEDFVGSAKEILTNTVKQQSQLGLRTEYQERSHDLSILFYSPDGMSIELMDKVEYDVRVLDQNKLITSQRESARYLVVLTPAEVRWKVRVFQAIHE